MSKGILGSMFDLDRDGELNSAERAAEFMFFHDVLLADREEEEEESDDTEE